MDRSRFFLHWHEITRDCVCDSCQKDDGRLVFCWKDKNFALCRDCVIALYHVRMPAIEHLDEKERFESLSKEPYNDESLDSKEATDILDSDDCREPLLFPDS